MANGVDATDLPVLSTATHFLVNDVADGIEDTGQLPLDAAATLLLSGGPIADALAAADAGFRLYNTWAELAGQPGTAIGQSARVAGPDAGTHTDPVVGGTVANTGDYRWSPTPGPGWRRVGATITASGALASKNTVGTSDIDDGSVTNAKLANMTAAKVKGRLTGTGAPVDVSMADLPISTDTQAALDLMATDTEAALDLKADLTALAALDAAAVKTSGNQTVAGVKTFSSAPVVPDGSFSNAKLANMAAAKVKGRLDGTGAPLDVSMADLPVSTAMQAALDLKAGFSLFLWTQGLPGYSPERFTSEFAGDPETAPSPAGIVSSTPYGKGLQFQGAGTVAFREPVRIAPSTDYNLFFAAYRVFDTSDPFGDAVEFGVAWLNGLLETISTTVITSTALLNSAGKLEQAVVLNIAAKPAGAQFFRPYIRAYGGNGHTAALLCNFHPLYGTEAAAAEILDDITALAAQVAADRVTVLNAVASVGNPRQRRTSSLIKRANPSGNDAATGEPGDPYQTLQRLTEEAYKWDHNSFPCTLQIEGTSFAENLYLKGTPVGIFNKQDFLVAGINTAGVPPKIEPTTGGFSPATADGASCYLFNLDLVGFGGGTGNGGSSGDPIQHGLFAKGRADVQAANIKVGRLWAGGGASRESAAFCAIDQSIIDHAGGVTVYGNMDNVFKPEHGSRITRISNGVGRLTINTKTGGGNPVIRSMYTVRAQSQIRLSSWGTDAEFPIVDGTAGAVTKTTMLKGHIFPGGELYGSGANWGSDWPGDVDFTIEAGGFMANALGAQSRKTVNMDINLGLGTQVFTVDLGMRPVQLQLIAANISLNVATWGMMGQHPNWQKAIRKSSAGAFFIPATAMLGSIDAGTFSAAITVTGIIDNTIEITVTVSGTTPANPTVLTATIAATPHS